MVNTKPILGDMRLNVTDNLGKYEVYNGETWVIMENYDTIESLRAQNSKLQTDLDIALSYIKQYELQIKRLQVAYEQEQYRSKQWQERFESGRLT
jgi:predicted RNase H-like nuclease (RuvC/YqgF family)